MSEEPTGSVHITGDERERPEIRKLARACLELARLELEVQHQQVTPPSKEDRTPPATSEGEEPRHE